MFQSSVSTFSGCGAFHKEVYSELENEWGKFLDGLAEWQWFFTGTFRRDYANPKGSWLDMVGVKTCWMVFKRFQVFIKKTAEELRYCAVVERQADGTPHIHALIGNTDKSYKEINEAWEIGCGAGFARSFPYSVGKHGGLYLAKYVVKDEKVCNGREETIKFGGVG